MSGTTVTAMKVLSWSLLLMVVSGCSTGCSKTPSAPLPAVPVKTNYITIQQLTTMLPENVSDRSSWAKQILWSLHEINTPANASNVCAVMAIIEQESGFRANPEVPGLSAIVKRRLQEYTGKLGPFGPPTLTFLLSGNSPASPISFEERLNKVRTEKDLDRLFRDIVDYYETQYPGTATMFSTVSQLFNGPALEAMNPITTAGAMQVSVRFAQEQATTIGRDPSSVRDDIYELKWGVYYGVVRLLDYSAEYKQIQFRFADYNAGRYSSRNAAFQDALSQLTGIPLALDGDLLAYNRDGEPTFEASKTFNAALAYQRFDPSLNLGQIRRDFLLEKTKTFEDSRIWTSVQAQYKKHRGKNAAYARLPDVALKSPKLKSERSTSWFAQSVQKRYDKFMALTKK